MTPEEFKAQYEKSPSAQAPVNTVEQPARVAPSVSPEDFKKRFVGKSTKKVAGKEIPAIEKPSGPTVLEGREAIPMDVPFFAKHPNLYGAFGVAQSLVPYLKYVDPEERNRFSKLSQQKQTRELLLQNLELVAMLGAPLITKGAVPLVAKYLPKTYKAFKFIKTPIKEWGELLATAPKEVAGKAMAEGEKLVAKKIATYKAFSGAHPPSKLITQWWKDSANVAKAKIAPKVTVAGDVSTQAVEEADPVKKVIRAIAESKPLRKKQETLYSQERSKRLGKAMEVGKKVPGEEGFVEQLSQLKGKFPKVDFKPIRSKLTQSDIDSLFIMVNDSPLVTGFNNIKTKGALAKLLGYEGGSVPTKSELVLLDKVFPKELTNALLKKRSLGVKLLDATGQALNVPRALMSAIDFSAPFRQGLFLINHPKRFFGAFKPMFKSFGSEKSYEAMFESIARKPTYDLMQESGLSLTELGHTLMVREERFMSQWAERIPGIGMAVRASGRAYTGFLDKLRADVFEDLVSKASKLGLEPRKNMDLTKQIAKFVNVASGRGGLGEFERAAVGINASFFSPRFISSRLTLLNPVYYIKSDPFVRKEALKSLLTLSSAIGTTLGMAKLGGLKVGTDPRSADFAKIKIGNTRIDISGGFQQYLRAAGQLISGEYVSSTTGKKLTLGEGYKPLTRLDILYRQIETKEAPVFSFITSMLKGQDLKGNKLDIPKEVAQRFTPMVLQDIYDIAKEDPTLIPVSALGIFGVGIQSYKATPPKPRGGVGAINNP